MAKVALSEEKETLLITLLAKAHDAREPGSVLQDHFAVDVIEQIDYDFARVKVNRDTSIGLALRAKILDDWTRVFIREHPDAIVLNLGCGLDSRIWRIDPPANVRWFDVDYPEVIALREQFYPRREGEYRMVGTSVTDSGWVEELVLQTKTMVVAEGLLYYLDPPAVDKLITRLLNRAPGGQFAFDVYSRLGVRIVNANAAIKATGAVLRWSIEQPEEIEKTFPSMKLLEEYNIYESDQSARMSFWFRLLLRTIGTTKTFRKLVRLLRYGF